MYFDPDDLADLVSFCQHVLAPHYPSISLDECVAVLAADESLYADLEQALRNDTGTKGIIQKASDIYLTLTQTRDVHGLGSGSLLRPPTSLTPEPPPKDENTVLTAIEAFVERLRPVFEAFIQKVDHMAKWCPPEGTPDFSWLRAQEFPSSAGKPDLLLHKLGSFGEIEELREQLDDIFKPNAQSHTFVVFSQLSPVLDIFLDRFLVNTSGSGKTKLMLEGLCLHWGFYFTSVVDSNLVGSFDVESAIEHNIPNSSGFVKDLSTSALTEYTVSLRQNRAIAAKRFSEILLARLIIFQLFIQIVKDRTDAAELRRLWVLIQIYPKRLGFAGGSDFFDRLTKTLFNSPHDWLRDQVEARFDEVRSWCNKKYEAAPFFLVLDEAHLRHFSAFRSEKNHLVHRPILREIVRAWVISFFRSLGLWMIIAGTGIDIKVIDRILASAVLKPAGHRLRANVGGFTSVAGHLTFMEQYMPPRILKTPSGRALLERMTYWLRGRYRFTTAFISELLFQGFRSPHRLLNSFVETHTGVTPTDGERWIAEESYDAQWPPEVELKAFEPEALANNPNGLERMLVDIVNSNIVRTGVQTNITVSEKLLVEYGFARYTEHKMNKIIIDEPLVFLTFSKSMRSSKWYSDRIRLQSSTMNGFEDYLAFALPHLFKSKPQLNQVFDFVGKPPLWSSHKTELVSVYQSERSSTPEILPVLPDARPHFGLGTDEGSNCQATVDWLKHKTRTFVCFPPKGMGPDLIFVLRVLDDSPEGGSLLWIAMQAKFSESRLLSTSQLQSAIRIITPERFWINESGGQYAPVAYPNLDEKTLAALKGLPNRIPLAGDASVLRVIAACPTPVALVRGKRVKMPYYKDEGKHPIASLNRQFLAAATMDLLPHGKIDSMIMGRRTDPVVPSGRELADAFDDESDSEVAVAEADDDEERLGSNSRRRDSDDDPDYSPARKKPKKTERAKSTPQRGWGTGASRATKGKGPGRPKKTKGEPRGGENISMASVTSAEDPDSDSVLGSSRAMSVDMPPPSVATASTRRIQKTSRKGKEY
ncbi:hypothetical protein B0H19DRAFT_1256079 [Mycena capillaripes]|nr:hypothetical protein B0H19DRAFT_1256079 [Mycena capillaripes]